jgi:hypothetical protein
VGAITGPREHKAGLKHCRWRWLGAPAVPHRQRCGGCTDQSQRLLLTPCPCLPASCLPSRYVVLAPTDSDQITLLANTLADKKLDELPLYAALLRKFSQKEVRRSGRGGRGERGEAAAAASGSRPAAAGQASRPGCLAGWPAALSIQYAALCGCCTRPPAHAQPDQQQTCISAPMHHTQRCA